jgi:tetratricopeptide (TPR) repeat protein
MLHRILAVSLVAASFASAQETPEPPLLWKKCGTEIPWMSDHRPLPDNRPNRKLEKTEVDLEDLFQEVRAKAKETGRPILWYIPSVVGGHMYRGTILDAYMNAAIWTDEAIVDLVNARFVPLRAACVSTLKTETKVDRWRVVEPAIVILNEKGEELHVIQRIRTFNAGFIYSALRSALEKGTPAAPAKDASVDDLIRGGWLETAAERLEPDKGAEARLQLARVRRLQGRDDEALKLLDEAGAAAKDAGLHDAIAVARGRTLLSLGKIEEARIVLENVASGKTLGAPAAAYHLALAERMRGRDTAAMELWEKLAKESPDTRWGWRAAANITIHKDRRPHGPGPVAFEDVLRSAAPSAGAATTRWERTHADLEDAARRAVAWLLRAQAANGSWNDARYAYWPNPDIQPNVFVAITGLACAALLEWKSVDPARIEAALAAGEKYLLDERNMARGKNEECYGDAYRLLYLVRKHATITDESAKKESLERMNGSVQKLAAIQDKIGFWAHEYPNPFTTAAVLQVLLRAKAAGAEVSEKMLAKGAEALKTTRGDRGRQAYGAGGPPSAVWDSSCRSAMCEGALLELKATEKAEFEAAMADFWTHLDRRERVRVCDFHSDGEVAGFFFFHGFFHTTEAIPLLEGKAREEAAARAAAHLAKIPEIDGSFIDSHEMGKSYGTAMALLSLKNALKK